MDETITRSAGANHGQEMTPKQMETTIRLIGRVPRQRNTPYGEAPQERYRASFAVRHDPARGAPSPTIEGIHVYCSNIDTNL